MSISPPTTLIKLALLLVLAVLIPGCITLPDEPDSRGVKLSDAMRSSANDDRRNLGGSDSHDTAPNVYAVTTANAADAAGFSLVSYDKSDYDWQALADVSYSTPFNGDIQSITHFTLTPVSIEDERNFLGLYVGGATVDLKPGSLPEAGVEQTWMLEAGLTYRRYMNSSWPAFSPYVAISAGYVSLNWNYRHPVFAGGDTVQSDSLEGVEGSIAFGISTRRDSRVSFFGEVGVGGTVFLNTTTQGFENDVFRNFGFVSVKAGLSVKF